MVLRYDIINHLIKQNNYRRYLEIGVEDGDSINQINCPLIHGVDPASKNATFEVPSDEFFKMLDAFNPDVKYDIIFIDGLHTEDQVDRDIINALNHLSVNGIIVIHDCNPPTEWHARGPEEAKKNGYRQWNGTVWRSIVKVRATRPDLEMNVVDTDWGCGLLRPRSASKQPQIPLELPDDFNYSVLACDREFALNLISVDQFFIDY